MTERRRVEPVLKDSDTVLALVRRSGRCDVADFIHRLAPQHKARFRRYFERLASGIPIKSPENYRTLRPRDQGGVLVAELKADKFRIYLVHDNGIWYATHGRSKPKDNRVPDEIDKALAFYLEWQD